MFDKSALVLAYDKNAPIKTLRSKGLRERMVYKAEELLTTRPLPLFILQTWARILLPANALGPGLDREKYIFAALVVPKS